MHAETLFLKIIKNQFQLYNIIITFYCYFLLLFLTHAWITKKLFMDIILFFVKDDTWHILCTGVMN